jgi:ferredoxin
MAKYFVNQDDCIGCGLCAELAPEVFKMNEEKAEAYKDNGENAEDACSSCPVNAIGKTED